MRGIKMSSIPEIDKSKYNKDDKFAWVDSQWEKFLTEQRELKKVIIQLQEDLVTCNKHFQKQRDEMAKDNDYINDLEQDNYRLIDMVTELSGDVPETKVKLKTNQLDLFEDK